MAERNLERFGVGIVIILILALTPLIAWLCESAGLKGQWYDTYVERILTGILIYVAAMYALSGLSDDDSVEVEGDPGKLTLNWIMLVAGVLVIGVGWLTDISSYIVDYCHLAWWLTFNGAVYKIVAIQQRLILAAFTFIGAFLIKHAFGRRDRDTWEPPDETEVYEKTKRNRG